MKKIFLLLFSVCAGIDAQAQHDTLKNHASGLPLDTDQYTAPSQWGYYLGHNYKYQQQFAEKYYVSGHTHVIGVVAHLTGTYTNGHNEAFFRVFEVGTNGLPGTELEHGHADFEDLDLSGGATVVLFHHEAHAEDSFFVSFDLGDYAHGGHEGDTIGLLYAPDGSRDAADLANFGRNVIQEHSHSSVVWKDFYSQNFTPVATHLAIYPIVELDHVGISSVFAHGLTLSAPYPNPAVDQIYIPFSLDAPDQISIEIMDMSGRIVYRTSKGSLSAGTHLETIGIGSLEAGYYNVVIRSGKAALATRILKGL